MAKESTGWYDDETKGTVAERFPAYDRAIKARERVYKGFQGDLNDAYEDAKRANGDDEK